MKKPFSGAEKKTRRFGDLARARATISIGDFRSELGSVSKAATGD